MMTPTIHLNGTSRQQLQAEYVEAYTQLSRALQGLSGTCPNARDYYVQGPHAYGQAMAEYQARLKAVTLVRDEMLAIYEAIEEAPTAGPASSCGRELCWYCRRTLAAEATSCPACQRERLTAADWRPAQG